MIASEFSRLPGYAEWLARNPEPTCEQGALQPEYDAYLREHGEWTKRRAIWAAVASRQRQKPSDTRLRAVTGDERGIYNPDEPCLTQCFYDPSTNVPMATAPRQEAWFLPIFPDPASQQRDIANHGVAEMLREYLEHFLPGRLLFDQNTFWAYAAGCWREIPRALLESRVSRFHQKAYCKVAGGERKHWDANVSNIKSVVTLLGHTMSHDQMDENLVGEGILARSSCLATFGDDSIYMHEGRPYLSKTGPGLRAQFAYDFAFEEGLEPAHLLDVMRRDWFRGVEETERERRIQCLREFIGHCFLGSMHLANAHRMLICIGAGHDGKSVLQSLVRRCVPPGSWCSVNIQDLENGACDGEFNRAHLMGKLVNLIDDMSAATITENGTFKSAVSYKPIRARPIRGEAITFTPRAAWWGNLNPKNGKLPKLEGQSGGMLRRLLCIEFPNSVRYGKEIGDLEDRILGLEKRELVCWAVSAALQMLREKRSWFTIPACHQRILDLWVSSALGNDSVSSFVKHACVKVENENEWTDARSTLFPQFDSWVEAMGGSEAVRAKAKCEFHVFMARLRDAGVICKRVSRNGTRTQAVNIKVQSVDDLERAPEQPRAPAAAEDAPVFSPMERRDVPTELRFTDQNLPRALPPRPWRDAPRLDDTDDDGDDQCDSRESSEDGALADRWEALSHSERAALLDNSQTAAEAARMATAHARSREAGGHQ